MKKLIIIIVAVLLATASLSAQKLGLVGGLSFDYGALSLKDPLARITSLPNAGMHVGLQFEMDVTNRWGFDAQVTYQLRNMRWHLGYDDGETVTRTMDRMAGYLDVPFHFYVNFHTKGKYVLSIFAGPVFACGVHAHDWAWEQTDLRKPVAEGPNRELDQMFDKDKGRIIRCQFALEAGLALKKGSFQGRISYQHSLNNNTLNNYTYTLPTSVSPYMTEGQLKISFAYMFDLRK